MQRPLHPLRGALLPRLGEASTGLRGRAGTWVHQAPSGNVGATFAQQHQRIAQVLCVGDRPGSSLPAHDKFWRDRAGRLAG